MNATPQLAIKITSGSRAGQVCALGENAFVGSGSQCEIQIADPGIAPLHGRINWRGNAYTLVDLTDAPSVRVNNHVIKSRKLSLGDRITIAGVAMEVVDAAELAVPPAAKEPEIVLVATEPASKTAEIGAMAADPWPEPLPPTEHRTERRPDRASARRPQYYRPEVAIQGKKIAERKASRVVMVSVVVVLIGIVGGLFLMLKQTEERKAKAIHHEAVEFARTHPDDEDQVIDTYREAQRKCAGIRPDLAQFFAAEIEKREAGRVAREREFETLIRMLDKKAKELAAADSFDKARKVYEVEDGRFKARIAEERKAVIAGLKQKAALQAAGEKEEQEKKETDQKAQREAQLKEDVKLAVAPVLDAVLGGQYDRAVELLERMGADAKFAARKEKVDEAITSVKLLRATDITFAATARTEGGGENPAGQGVVPDATSTAVLDTLPALIRAVYQIRAGDQLSAQTQLKKEPEHLFYAGLLARAQVSEEQLKTENEGLLKMTRIWAKIVNDPAAKLPQPADGAAQLNKAAKEGNREQVLKASSELLQCRTDYGKTKLVKDYAELFDAADKLPGIPQFTVSKLSGLGDGRVIQIEGDTYYVEANNDLVDVKDGSIGLCKEETVYYALDTNKAVGAWVDIYSILPFRVLSERQVVFSLMTGQKKQTPAVGDCVLINKELQTGRKFVAGMTRVESVAIFSDDFEKNLAEPWRCPVPAMALDNGKLSLDVGAVEQKRKPDEGDLELNLDLGTGPIGLEFDVTRKPDAALRLVVGALEFVIGDHEGRKGGIYAGGKLVKPADFPRPVLGVSQHVSITKSRTLARVEVNKVGVECRLSPNAGESDVKKVFWFNNARILFDNVRIKRLSGTGDAKVVGVSTDRKEVVILRGYEAEWQTVAAGQDVYFFSGKPNETNCFAKAKVKDDVEPWLVCSTEKGLLLGAGNLVSLSPGYPETPTGEQMRAEPVKPRKQSSDLLYALVKPAPAVPGTLSLETPGYVPDRGFLCPVTERLTNAVTAEALALVPGDAIKCEFKQETGAITCSPLEGAALPDMPSLGFLLSKAIVPPNRRLDVPAYSFSYAPGAPGSKKDFWNETNGEWKEKAGRTIGTPSILSEGPAVATLNEIMGDGVQCDLDVRIEKEGKPSEDPWIKPLLVELYFPARQIGIMVGVGGEKAGGVSLMGHTVSQEKGKQALVWSGTLPDTFRARVEGGWDKGAPLLKVGQSYTLRVRRVKDALTFYINGKRLAHVRHAQFDGDMQLRIAGADATLSIGKVAGLELPRSYKTPDEEPPLGEFGYVVWADGGQVLVDADMNGIAPNRKVSIMAIDKVVKGEKSKTIFLKKVALGTVTDVGMRTAKILCTEGAASVAKGMKVLPGNLPAAVTFTDARLQDLDQGL